MRGARAAAEARAKRQKTVLQSDLQKRVGREKPPAVTLTVGAMLARDSDARRKGELLRFQVCSDPMDVVAKVSKIPVARKKGHVVIAPFAPNNNTDYALSATIVAAFLGCFGATPKDFLRKDGAPRGISYKRVFNNTKQLYHVAVSAVLARDLPTLPLLLESIAVAPGSCVKYYRSEDELCRAFKKNSKSASTRQAEAKIQQRTCVLSKKSDHDNAKSKFKLLYVTPQSFISRFDGSPCGAFPGELER